MKFRAGFILEGFSYTPPELREVFADSPAAAAKIAKDFYTNKFPGDNSCNLVILTGFDDSTGKFFGHNFDYVTLEEQK